MNELAKALISWCLIGFYKPIKQFPPEKHRILPDNPKTTTITTCA